MPIPEPLETVRQPLPAQDASPTLAMALAPPLRHRAVLACLRLTSGSTPSFDPCAHPRTLAHLRFGGSEDHTAILLCEAGKLRQYSFCPTALEASLPFPQSLAFVVAVSGATARKGAERLADYNNAALLASWAAEAAASGVSAGAVVTQRPTLASVTASAAVKLGLPPSSDAVRDHVIACMSSADDGTHPSGCAPGMLRERYESTSMQSGGNLLWHSTESHPGTCPSLTQVRAVPCRVRGHHPDGRLRIRWLRRGSTLDALS